MLDHRLEASGVATLAMFDVVFGRAIRADDDQLAQPVGVGHRRHGHLEPLGLVADRDLEDLLRVRWAHHLVDRGREGTEIVGGEELAGNGPCRVTGAGDEASQQRVDRLDREARVDHLGDHRRGRQRRDDHPCLFDVERRAQRASGDGSGHDHSLPSAGFGLS